MSWRPAASMMRLVPLDPMTSLFSLISTSNGDAIESHPPIGPVAFASENITDAVPPAETTTLRSADPVSFRTVTMCSSAVRSRSEEHTSELQSQFHLVCRLLLEKKKQH